MTCCFGNKFRDVRKILAGIAVKGKNNISFVTTLGKVKFQRNSKRIICKIKY